MKNATILLVTLWLMSGSLPLQAEITQTNSFMNLNQAIPDGNASGLHDVRTISSAIPHLASVRLKLRVAGEFNGDLYGYLRHILGGVTNFCVLLNRVGRTAASSAGYADAGLDVLLADAAPLGDIHIYRTVTNPPAGTSLIGTWQPDGRRVDPAVVVETTARTATLSSFNNADGNGEWTLYVADLAAGGTNMLVSWELQLSGIATPAVTWPKPADIVYGAAIGPAQLNASSPVSGSFAYSPASGAVLNAGSNQTLSVTFTPADSSSYLPVTNTVSINVLKAPLTITALNTNKVYGQTVTLAGTQFSSSGLVNSDTVSSVSLASAGAAPTATVAGSPYTIVPSAATGSGLANYTITYANGTLTVSTKVLTITANNTNKVYGQTVTLAGTQFSSSGLVNSDTVTSVSLTSAGAVVTATVAGSPYTILPSAATGTGLANYTVNYANGTLAVSTKALTITANNTNKVYGQTVTLAGTQFSSSGLVNSDTVTSVSLTSAGAVVTATVAGSPYTILPSAATGTGLANYTINYVNGTLAVSTKALTITANNTNKVYGQTVTLVGTQFSSSGLVNSDTVTSVNLSSAGAVATATVAGSPYTIVPSAATGTGLANYTINYANGTLALAKASTSGALSSSSNPSPPSQPVVFTLTLNAVAPGAGTPTGVAQFRTDGTNAGGAVSLSGGVAGFSTTVLAHGTHAVVAEYAGDGNFTGTTNSLSSTQLINTLPVAGPGTVERDPTNGVKVAIGTLLRNCSDGDGDPLSFLSVSATSANGGTVVSNGGWVFYTPAPGFTNSDSFTYTIGDGWGTPATGVVTVNIRTNNGPSPNLIISDLGSGRYFIVGDGIPDRTYRIQFADNAPPTNWQTLGTASANASGIFQLIDTNGVPQRFYRSVYP
jgi:subtilisin-like proprotein convertase family protein